MAWMCSVEGLLAVSGLGAGGCGLAWGWFLCSRDLSNYFSRLGEIACCCESGALPSPLLALLYAANP